MIDTIQYDCKTWKCYKVFSFYSQDKYSYKMNVFIVTCLFSSDLMKFFLSAASFLVGLSYYGSLLIPLKVSRYELDE